MKQEQITTATKPVGDTLCVLIISGDINNMTQAQRLSCCRQFLVKMGVVCELPAAGNSRAFPDSLFLSDRGLQQAVKNCKDVAGLLNLYNDNKERIETHPWMKSMFTERKNELRKKRTT